MAALLLLREVVAVWRALRFLASTPNRSAPARELGMTVLFRGRCGDAPAGCLYVWRGSRGYNPDTMPDAPVTATLLISCRDQKGLVAAVSDFLYRNDGNIIHADQHTDLEEGVFVQRVEWELRGVRGAA